MNIVNMELCDCGHPDADHMDSLPDAEGNYFVTCDYCPCLEEYSQFDAG